MNKKNRVYLVTIICVTLVALAVLIWANQTGKITIWGDGPEDTKPTITLGLPITIDGILNKEGDYFVLTKNKQLSYNVYILNSEDTDTSLTSFLNKEVSVYGSLGGKNSNELFVFWVNGKTIYEESVGRFIYKERISQSVGQIISNFSQTQKDCLDKVVSSNELESFLSGWITNLTKEQINKINSCMNE